MNPKKVVRTRVVKLTDLPNVGPATGEDLHVIGLHKPADLVGQNPYSMFERLCEATGVRHDNCVIDVFISITRFMDGGRAQPWWHFTKERKRKLEQGDE